MSILILLLKLRRINGSQKPQHSGGVGIIWRKTIHATPITSITSDRICGIHLKLPQSGGINLTVFGVYLPCSDTGMEHYSEYLIELEQVISEQQHHGPVVIMGNFNAHLGTLGGVINKGYSSSSLLPAVTSMY